MNDHRRAEVTLKSLAVVACEVFTREVCALVATSPCETNLRFVPKGLHNLPCGRMLAAVQEAVDAASAVPGAEAVVLAYGMCNRGLDGLRARTLPLVVPKAHDCIGVMLGSVDRHRAVLDEVPGTYFLSSGWIEHGRNDQALDQASIPRQLGLDRSREELVERYGEENADYLWSVLGQAGHYTRIAYLTGLDPAFLSGRNPTSQVKAEATQGLGGSGAKPAEPLKQTAQRGSSPIMARSLGWGGAPLVGEARFAAQAQERATQRGWGYTELAADPSLLQALIWGQTDDIRLLLVPPGQQVHACYAGAEVARAVPCPLERARDASHPL